MGEFSVPEWMLWSGAINCFNKLSRPENNPETAKENEETMANAAERSHQYHAEARILEGELNMPFRHTIHPHGLLQLPGEGGYRSAHTRDYQLEGVMSYSRAYSQVSGIRDTKQANGFSTLCTTVVENLNILEILTADRVVGQIITEHPLDGYVPKISFLGTRFENLCIAGHKVDLDWDLDIFGERPANDAVYTKESGVVKRVSDQYERIRGSKDLPAEMAEQYNGLSSTLGSPETVECSLVNQAAGTFPGKSFGHVIKVRHFGVITLGKLSLTHSNPHPETKAPRQTVVQLTMIDLKLGCVGNGNGGVGGGTTGGNTGS